jgi:hypothetical protein
VIAERAGNLRGSFGVGPGVDQRLRTRLRDRAEVGESPLLFLRQRGAEFLPRTKQRRAITRRQLERGSHRAHQPCDRRT